VAGNVGAVGLPDQGKFIIQKADVKRGVMNDQLRAFDEVKKLISNFCKAGLAHQKLVGNAVNANCALVTLTIRLQIHVKMPTGQTAAHQLDATDLDYPVAIGNRHTGGFSIEYNTTHA